MFKFLSWNKSKHVDILSMIWIQLVVTTSILVLIIMVMWYMICIEVLELYTWLSLGRPACMYRFSSCFWFCKYLCMHLSGRFFFSFCTFFFEFEMKWYLFIMLNVYWFDRFQGVFFSLLDTKKKKCLQIRAQKRLSKGGSKTVDTYT